jgi:hypothetical protein
MAFKMFFDSAVVSTSADDTVATISSEFTGEYQVRVKNVDSEPCKVGTTANPYYTLFPRQELAFNATGNITLKARCLNNHNPATGVLADSTQVEVAAFGEE